MTTFFRAVLSSGLLAMPVGALAQPADVPILPDTAPNSARQVEAPQIVDSTAGGVATVGEPTFRLNGITLEGATAIDSSELEPIWRDFVGQDVTVPILNEIAERISAAYRAQGFFLSQAVLPAQTVTGGIVQLIVVEGFVDDIALTGGAPNQRQLVARYFEPVSDDRPLRLDALERGVLLSRDVIGSVTGSSVETILGPSPDTFGAANLTVRIEEQPLSGYVSVDNRGSRLYGDWTLGAGVQAVNALGWNETLDGSLAIAPDDAALAFAALSVEVPIVSLSGTRLDGARLRFAGNIFRGDPDLSVAGDTTGLISISDQTEISAQLIVPFVRTRSANLFGRSGLIFRENESRSGLPGLTAQEDERLSIFELGMAWDFADTRGGISFVDLSLRQGLNLAGAGLSAVGPAAGDAQFTSAQLTLSRLQSFGDNPWSLFVEFNGQITRSVQPNSERFYLGGASIGRGFAPGNTSGDSGYAARLEVRRSVDVGPWAQAANVFGFVDYGRAYDRAIARDGAQWESLGSVGIGAQIAVNDWLSLTPQIVRQTSGTPGDTRDRRRETRVFFGAVGRF